mmetsp:Transcript_8748/g.13996  ORF Transcript_8748/g.13996 Transcript_8748/m.13996 type:complete len:310 (-) Transcript_8748:1122-2051(-)|eukprot:CAMPEP_0178739540 /NCGR_PEP_ID=MMETSP0744-20121128/4111_1 /TAXON_ID=913974 /ORGANISM="Nitzschia punctata, Strain CCMP561" /LENGTH=309 /DNA_ID=CAMNT_0020392253 /DNA_START=71 /DNA_END=1000 /DNA_ORIENTATION=-
MKLSTALVALTTLAAASAKKISGGAAQKMVRSARKLEDQNQDQQAEEDFAFLGYYDAKVVGCKKDLETPMYNEQGEYEYEAVLVRLCPSDAGCDSDSTHGCKGGYGDMLVGLTTFVAAYFEDQRDNMQWDDAFEVDKFAECEEYNPDENADDGNQGQWENYQFFIGPTCTDDGLDVKLAVFSDEYCTQVSEYDFETISNGWTLPYGDGGLVSTKCNSCTEYNDNGELELREMCMQSYEMSPYKCEEGMEYYSYYGQNTQGCEMIAATFPSKKSGGSGGKVFGWIVFTLVVVGLAGYIVWWRKKKASTVE